MSRNMPNTWSNVKKAWRKANPPDAEGFYICWICKHELHESKLTLDHVAPLEQYPEFAKELSNLRPAHAWCNQERARNKYTSLINRFGNSRRNHGQYYRQK